MKSTLYVEYQEKQLEEKDLVAKAKKTWYTVFLMKIPEVNLLSINIV